MNLTAKEITTESDKRDRSGVSFEITPQTKTKFDRFVQKTDLKNAKYLQKYREVVELIFEMQARNFQDIEVREQVTELFKIEETTYYNIKRILSNSL